VKEKEKAYTNSKEQHQLLNMLISPGWHHLSKPGIDA